MSRLRLRTKFLIAMLLTSAGLTAVSLLIVQRTRGQPCAPRLEQRSGQLGRDLPQSSDRA